MYCFEMYLREINYGLNAPDQLFFGFFHIFKENEWNYKREKRK